MLDRYLSAYKVVSYTHVRKCLSKRSGIESLAAKEGLPIHVVVSDLADDKSVISAFQRIIFKAGRIDAD
jgi:NAD(P)-dependent dehydrogenase (short-subunit alcohol dehydrogenase family)